MLKLLLILQINMIMNVMSGFLKYNIWIFRITFVPRYLVIVSHYLRECVVMYFCVKTYFHLLMCVFISKLKKKKIYFFIINDIDNLTH